MTLWLANLAAYSVQLVAVVGTGYVVVALLRVRMPRAALAFWQLVFASSLLWPLWQVSGAAAASSPYVSETALWNVAASNVLDMRAGVSAIGVGLAALLLSTIALGGIVRLARIGLGLLQLRRMRRCSEPAHSVAAIARCLQDELGVSADIRFSSDVASPATVGVWRPLVLLPRRVHGLAPAVQRSVLCHELLHIRRRDWLSTMVEEVWCAVLWFHPAARVLASRLSLARETLVDETTVALTGDRRAYAQALLEFSSSRPRLVGAPLIGGAHLAERVRLLTQEVSMSRSSLAVRLVAACVAVSLTTVAVSSAVPMASTLYAQGDKVYRPSEDKDVVLPRVVREVKPVYTAAAMQAKIQGTVMMLAVVRASGEVGDVTIIKSLDQEHGLDEQAVEATRQWVFEPGTRGGQPVAVEVTIEMTFTLKQ